MNARALVLGFLGAFLPAAAVAATANDQAAWNAAWGQMRTLLPDGVADEHVHVLNPLVAATWGGGNTNGARDLQDIAGAIPPESFSYTPFGGGKTLHGTYTDIVLSIVPTQLSPEQQRKYLAAADKYKQADDAYQVVRDRYDAAWKDYMEDLRARGEAVTSAQKLRFNERRGSMFTAVDARMDVAGREFLAALPKDWKYTRDVLALVDAVRAKTGDREFGGLYSYWGGEDTLNSLDDCTVESPTGWETLSFKKAIDKVDIQSSGWNAHGGWSGSFFGLGLGGGGSNYTKVLSRDTDSVSVMLCNRRVITLAPGPWFSWELLYAIDRGEVKLNGDKYNKQHILGPGGVIPYTVTAAVVARQVDIDALLTEMQLREAKSASGRRGGFRVGPISLGGGRGSSSYSRTEKTSEGRYRLSTASTVPIVVAVITQETPMVAPAGAPSDGARP